MLISQHIIIFLSVAITFAKKSFEDPTYTQNIETFNSDRRPHRMQMLAGCWLVVMDELDRQKTNFNVTQAVENATITNTTIDSKLLSMIKKCLRKITLKEAVNKVAALVDKNMTAPKSFIEVVGNFTDEEVNPDVSPFDEHLSTIITNFTRELAMLRKGNIKELMEEEIKKKSKYLWGIIPMNSLTKTTGLILLTVAFISFCTCWKVYKKNNEKRSEKRERERLEALKKKGSKKISDVDIAAAAAQPGVLPLKKKRF